jgi:hypothetical protein
MPSSFRLRWCADWGSLLALCVLLLWPAWTLGDWPGTGVDLYGTVWFYGWIRQSVEQGFDPSFTQLFFYPNGKDIFAHTGNNFIDAYLSIPFQWIFGRWFPAPFFTALLLGNVIAFRWWIRELGTSLYMRWILSVLWLLNPYCIAELSMGRPTQLLLFPTFCALVFMNRMVEEDGSAWFGLGVFVALQGWCYWFYGFFVVQLLVLYGVTLVYRKKIKWQSFVFPFLKSIAVCLLLISPGVILMSKIGSQQDIPGMGLIDGSSWQDLRSAMVPWIRGVQVVEPIGHPMFKSALWGMVLVCAVVGIRRHWSWLFVALGMTIVALGPFQSIGEQELLNYPYLWLVSVLPFFERLWFPYRALGFVFIAVVTQLALFSRSFSVKGVWHVVLPTGILCLGGWDLQNVESLPIVHTVLPKSSVQDCMDAPTIQIPIGFVHPTMTWQTHNPQPYFGGMGENGLLFLPDGYIARLQNPFVQYLKTASLMVDTTRTYSPFDRARIVDIGFRYVLWDRSMTEMERFKRQQRKDTRPRDVFKIQQNLIEELGLPICADAQWLLFDLQRGDVENDEFPHSSDWSWNQPSISGYEERLRELGRVPK